MDGMLLVEDDLDDVRQRLDIEERRARQFRLDPADAVAGSDGFVDDLKRDLGVDVPLV